MIKFFNMNFSDKRNWSEGHILDVRSSIADDDATNDNLDFFVVPQHGRKPDYIG